MKTESETYTKCVDYFLSAYYRRIGFDYVFSGKDGKALKEILKAIAIIKKEDVSSYDTFVVIIDRLPPWVIDGYFSLPNINKYFNQIIKQIKDESNSKKRGVSGDYVRRQLDILQS